MNLLQATELAARKGSEEVRCTMQADEVLLFRYSALTFNSHKIHYDRRHCIEVEKYPGLIVHGPLMACLMGTLAWFQAGSKRPAFFAFRALSPVFDGDLIEVIAKPSRSLSKESLLFSQLSNRGHDFGMQRKNGDLKQALLITD
jgi:hydroxyacyl-ACP dehydratase HTD2-like protein with hotdog domain